MLNLKGLSDISVGSSQNARHNSIIGGLKLHI